MRKRRRVRRWMGNTRIFGLLGPLLSPIIFLPSSFVHQKLKYFLSQILPSSLLIRRKLNYIEFFLFSVTKITNLSLFFLIGRLLLLWWMMTELVSGRVFSFVYFVKTWREKFGEFFFLFFFFNLRTSSS